MKDPLSPVANTFRNLLLTLCVGSSLMYLSGCATTVESTMQTPARYPGAAELRRVASLGFEGHRYKHQVNAAFETMLVNHYYDGEPYFTVADRARTQELMAELKRSLGAEIDSSTAIRFGKKIGVQGIYFGDITTQNFTNRRYEGSERYCQRKEDDKCKKWGSRKVSCTERTASITLVPRLVNAETGQVVYREQHLGQASSSACRGSPQKDDQTLFTEALDIAIANIRRDISPSTSLVDVELMDKPSSLNDKDAEQFRSGLQFAKAKRMDRACEIWRSLNRRTQSGDNALLYNVAVCEELEGNLGTALELFTLVDRRLVQPDRKVSSAMRRITSTLNTKASTL